MGNTLGRRGPSVAAPAPARVKLGNGNGAPTESGKVRRALGDLPTAIASHTFTFLTFDEHSHLAQTSRQLHGTSLLATSSCRRLEFCIVPWARELRPNIARHRPANVRVKGHADNRALGLLLPWLSRAANCQTLSLRLVDSCDLSALSGLVSLRSLVLRGPVAFAVATALATVGPQLRVLRILQAERVNWAANIGVPAIGESRHRGSSVAAKLARCVALESLMLETESTLPLGCIAAVSAARLPALRSLFLVESSNTKDTSSLSALSSLSFFAHHVTKTRHDDFGRPSLLYLAALDLGSSNVVDGEVLVRCFPRITRLRMALFRPAFLAKFALLESLTLVDQDSPCRHLFADELGEVLPLLTKLVRLGVHCYRVARNGARRMWSLPHVEVLTLCLPAHHIRPVHAPRLVVLRGNVLPRAFVAQMFGASLGLAQVHCNSAADSLSDADVQAMLKAAPGRQLRVVRHSAIRGVQPLHDRPSYEAPHQW